MIFYDTKTGKTLRQVSIPNAWNTWNPSQKQQWRDDTRKVIGIESNIADPSERNIALLRTLGTLSGESDTSTTLSLARTYGEKITRNDSKRRTRLQYVEDEFQNLLKGYPLASNILAGEMIGLIVGESRFNSDLESRTGAVGIFQIMPAMIKSTIINPEQHSTEVVSQSLQIQVDLAKNLFLDNWSRLKNMIPKVATQYFAGDQAQAVEYVLLPLLISTFNTGYPNVKRLLDGFLIKYPDQVSIADEYKVQYTESMGSDIYYYMTQYGRYDAGIKSYKHESALYYYKTLALTRIMRNQSIKAEVPVSSA